MAVSDSQRQCGMTAPPCATAGGGAGVAHVRPGDTDRGGGGAASGGGGARGHRQVGSTGFAPLRNLAQCADSVLGWRESS
jgi:hypothetical protein